MKKTILVFGLISGVLSSAMMVATLPFMGELSSDRGYVIGYTAIVLSFLLVFFGIRSYRDNVSDGHITFSKGFLIGLGITLISCVFYVATWEIVYYNFLPNFWDNYGKHVQEKMTASGASAAAVEEQIAKIQQYKKMYANPLFNAAMTFIEPFPVGLLITLLSAAVLRKKPNSQLVASV